MGYYVNITDQNFTVKKENFPAAYDALCAINDEKYNHLKRGGSHGPDGQTAYWYSWMPENYPAETETLLDILDLLGFAVHLDSDGNIDSIGYDNKTGNEEIFFMALAPYVKDGSWVLWHGEDDEIWGWEFADGRMYLRSVRITLAGERSTPTYLHINEHLEPGTKGRYEHRPVVL